MRIVEKIAAWLDRHSDIRGMVCFFLVIGCILGMGGIAYLFWYRLPQFAVALLLVYVLAVPGIAWVIRSINGQR